MMQLSGMVPGVQGKRLRKLAKTAEVHTFGTVLFDFFLGRPPDEVFAKYLELNVQLPSIGRLLRECLSPTPANRVRLRDAADRLGRLGGGGEAMQSWFVAPCHIKDLPSLKARPPH